MGKKKTETKNEPWKAAQPYILDNLADTKATFDQNQPALQGYATMQQGTYGRLAPGAEQGITGAQSLVNRNLSGANLTGNPYLEGIIGTTRRNVTDSVNGMFNSAGRFGSSANQGVLTEKLAEAENAARFGNYNTERGYQQAAIGDAQNLMGGATGLLNNAAQLPWLGIQAQNGGTNSLTNGYGVKTTTESGGLGSVLGGLAGTLGGAAISKYSDERIKNVGKQVGIDPNTGLPLYDYTYKGDPAQTPQVGVMAQDVEQVRPDAVGSDPNGVKTVNYGALGMPDPAQLAALKQDVPQIREKFSIGGMLGGALQPGSAGIGDTVSRIGESLLAGAGGGWSDIGRGLMGARADRMQQANEDRKFGLDAARVDDGRTAAQKDLQAAGLRPGTKEYSDALRQIALARVLPTGFVMGPNGQPAPMPGFVTPEAKDAKDFEQTLTLQGMQDARAERAAAAAEQRSLRSQEAADRRFYASQEAMDRRANAPSKLRALPPTAATGIQGNLTALQKVDAALAALSKNPGAVGFSNMLTPDAILQRGDPKGVDARSKIGEVGAVKIHDLSGAAVSASEAPRFTPFVPSINDSAATARKKLENFKSALQAQLGEQQDFYGEANGYQPYRTPGAAAARATPAAAAPAKPAGPMKGQVVKGYRFNGGDPANPKSWSKAK